MKKISYLLLPLILCLCIPRASAQYQDDLLRSAGFFVSPGITNFSYIKGDLDTKVRFAPNFGFRFKNDLGKGFFLEGGAGVSCFGTQMPATFDTIRDMFGNVTNVFGEVNKYIQIKASTPFLAGYRTRSRKVRFEGALGFAFYVNVLEHTSENRYTVNGPFNETNGSLRPRFGTSFAALARAGISIPFGERGSIDILPSLQYSFGYFTPQSKDIGQCFNTDIHKWNAGINIGLTWKLNDPEPKGEWTTAQKTNKKQDQSFTYNYSDENPPVDKPAKVKPKGPRNFIYAEFGGNGMALSFNYERTLFRKNLMSLNARAGFGYVPDFFGIPLGVNVALGKYHKKFEMGLGATMETFTTQDLGYYVFKAHLVPSLGFRLETDSHFFLRLALMSHYYFDTHRVLPGIGVSIGGCF